MRTESRHLHPSSRFLAMLVLFLCGLASARAMAQEASPPATKREGPQLMDGEWIFVEDRTEGRTLEQISPPLLLDQYCNVPATLPQPVWVIFDECPLPFCAISAWFRMPP